MQEPRRLHALELEQARERGPAALAAAEIGAGVQRIDAGGGAMALQKTRHLLAGIRRVAQRDHAYPAPPRGREPGQQAAVRAQATRLLLELHRRGRVAGGGIQSEHLDHGDEDVVQRDGAPQTFDLRHPAGEVAEACRSDASSPARPCRPASSG